jgi:hypothetical protein
MSTRDKSLFTTTALAVAFAVTTLAGSAFAADMVVKAAPAPAPPPFFIVNDTSVSFTWYLNATNPGVAGSSDTINGGVQGTGNSFSKWVGSATHFDVWSYGTNFFNIDYIQSDKHDPERGVAGARGAAETYAFARSTLSGNAVTGTKMFSSWFFKDISLEYGGDVNTNNDAFSPHVLKFDVGASFTFNLPGTVILGVVTQKEWNHSQFLVVPAPGGLTNQFTGDREFKWIPRLELLVSEPLTFLPWPLTWNSFTGVNFPKGTGTSGQNIACAGAAGCAGGITQWSMLTNETKTEVFADNRLTLDISKLAWGKPGIWDGYVGYRYWYNKFGTDHNNGDFATIGCTQAGSFGCAPGTSVEQTAYIGTTYHFK